MAGGIKIISDEGMNKNENIGKFLCVFFFVTLLMQVLCDSSNCKTPFISRSEGFEEPDELCINSTFI